MITTRSKETKIKLWVEVLIFLSSYYPLFLILFIRDVHSNTVGMTFGLPEWGLKVSVWAIVGLLCSSVATLATGRIMKLLFTRSEGSDEIRLTDVKAIRGDMINYTLPFLIGLFAFDYKSWQSILSLVVFLFFMFAFTRNEKIILLNPMFLLLGIRLYDIKYKKVGQPNTEHSSSALCLGVASKSDSKVRFLENSGITFISPLVDR
ncbi:hypothetical protein HPY09_15010 [Vibrio cholerae]|uniref:hypothetical protein n=1 Tax=Vibrio cholerae TaxID=666 RepID=UPI001581ACBD|nr:hypothetical protein [Vibrio cholerae]EGQ8476421.1 hypothetical protein [Vibrio cholerae]EGQ9207050.1 hypothetical protein [Vibrio cholerae]EGQ9334111.1 hypothetical protein [Vibrio cholerae]EGR0593906.1 hypothetical protein [Vibrio cholerae]EHD2282618.1 hypothetical protein [Vibrio cholerae]